MASDIQEDELDERLARSPIGILYRQIDRYLMLRMSGRGAEEALKGVLSCISTERDDSYNEDIKQIRIAGGNEWDVLQAVFRLLKRKNLWLQPPRALVRGEELLSAAD